MARIKANNGSEPQTVSRILLVDDHPMVRERLTDVINGEPELCVCGEAADRHEAMEAIAAKKPQLVIIDLNLNGSDGFDLIKDINVCYPDMLMLVVSMHDESVYAERALRAGADGYLNKQKATADVLVAIRKILAGKVYISETLAEAIACKVTGHCKESKFSLESLSDRELGVFRLIGQGYGMDEIAKQLHLDSKTVQTYRQRIKEKLGLANAREVLKYAICVSRTLTVRQNRE